MNLSEPLQKTIEEMRKFLAKAEGLNVVTAIAEMDRICLQMSPEMQQELHKHMADLVAQMRKHEVQVAELRRQLIPMQNLCRHEGGGCECIHCGANMDDE